MNDITHTAGNTTPAIVNERDNGLDYLRALCDLFEAPFEKIPNEKRIPALQLFTALYMYPAIENGSFRVQAREEMDNYMNEHFPFPDDLTAWESMKYGASAGLSASWGTQAPDVRAAYANTIAGMIVYSAKWRNLTMGTPDDLLQGYRWRRVVTGLFEAVAGVIGVGVLAGSADGVLGKGIEGWIKAGPRGAISQGAARLAAGGSGVIDAATRGRGVRALATRGGAAGLLGAYTIGYVYANLKDEEQDIRNAMVLMALHDEELEQYVDDMNGPIDALKDIYVEWSD